MHDQGRDGSASVDAESCYFETDFHTRRFCPFSSFNLLQEPLSIFLATAQFIEKICNGLQPEESDSRR